MKNNAQARYSVRAKFKTDCAIELVCIDSDTNAIYSISTLFIHQNDVIKVGHSKKKGDEYAMKGWTNKMMSVEPVSPLIYHITVYNLDTRQVTLIYWDILRGHVRVEYFGSDIGRFQGSTYRISTYNKCVDYWDLLPKKEDEITEDSVEEDE